MANGVKMVLEDVCSRCLQQEEKTHSFTSSHIPLACVSLRQEAELCLESNMPKMIAEASFICVTGMWKLGEVIAVKLIMELQHFYLYMLAILSGSNYPSVTTDLQWHWALFMNLPNDICSILGHWNSEVQSMSSCFLCWPRMSRLILSLIAIFAVQRAARSHRGEKLMACLYTSCGPLN